MTENVTQWQNINLKWRQCWLLYQWYRQRSNTITSTTVLVRTAVTVAESCCVRDDVTVFYSEVSCSQQTLMN